MTLRLEDVAHVPELKSKFFCSVAAHKSKFYSKPEEDEVTLSLLHGGLKQPCDGAPYCELGYRIDCNDVIYPSEVSSMRKVRVKHFPDDTPTTAVPVLCPGDSVSPTSDGIDFHCSYGHSNKCMSKESAKTLCVQLCGELKPCTGCSTAKGYR